MLRRLANKLIMGEDEITTKVYQWKSEVVDKERYVDENIKIAEVTNALRIWEDRPTKIVYQR